MAKFYGKIGYVSETETKPGIWKKTVTERDYYGDLIKNTRRLDGASQVNEGINISNEISIVADPYARDHFYSMRYVEFMNAKWKISNVDVQYPRLILSIGGLYNENED